MKRGSRSADWAPARRAAGARKAWWAIAIVLMGVVSCRRPALSRRTALDDEGGSLTDDIDPPPPVKDLKVKINEVMVENTRTIADGGGAFPPWIELYNPTDVPVDLAGVPLSDDLGQPTKWLIPRLPAAVIAPRGRLVIFCDGNPQGAPDLHAGFTLKPGFLRIILNEGADLFFFDARRLGTDQSAGRFPDGEEAISVLAAPTPGEVNESPAAPAEGAFIRGDADGNGRVNTSDMIAVLGVLFRSRPEPPCLDRLDSDDSGQVDLSDAVRIGDALFKHGPPFPLPFPQPGPDPTEDGLRCP